jgi:phosphoglycolate phosphatase
LNGRFAGQRCHHWYRCSHSHHWHRDEAVFDWLGGGSGLTGNLAAPPRARAGRHYDEPTPGAVPPTRNRGSRERRRPAIHRLILWNIDLTLVDVGQVSRDACADAFREVTGRPLVRLPLTAGRTDSEVFFEALAVNAPELDGTDNTQTLLAAYNEALATAFGARRDQIAAKGLLLPGAREALAAVAGLPGVVQTVLTGTIEPNARAKLSAFGLDELFDLTIGGYGSEPYPKGTLLRVTRSRAGEARGVSFGEEATVYIGDSPRDVEAARVGGARSVAVAGGRSTPAELTASGADAVLADLTDTPLVVRTIDALTSGVDAHGQAR